MRPGLSRAPVAPPLTTPRAEPSEAFRALPGRRAVTPPPPSHRRPHPKPRVDKDQRNIVCANLAAAFRRHLWDNQPLRQQASVRDGLSVVFQQWLSALYASSTPPPPLHELIDANFYGDDDDDDDDDTGDALLSPAVAQRCRLTLEALVMAHMRQQRWMKTKRLGGRRADTVLVYFTDDGGAMVEPAAVQQQQQQHHAAAMEAQRRSHENKHGVTVHPAGAAGAAVPAAAARPGAAENATLTVARGTPQRVTMRVEYDGESMPPPPRGPGDIVGVRWEAVALAGPRAHFVRLAAAAAWPRRLVPHQPQTIPLDVTVPPHYIGILRVAVHCRFRNITIPRGNDDDDDDSSDGSIHDDGGAFAIVRWIRIKGAPADAALDQVLQPSAPYQGRPSRPKRAAPHVQVYEPPPPAQRGTQMDNPFALLPQHRVPPAVKTMLHAGEFATAIVPWPAACEAAAADDADGDDETGSVDSHAVCEDRVKDRYGRFWKALLQASEFQLSLDIQLFDLTDVALRRSAGGRTFLLEVPGLAEGRPSVLRGDVVHVTWNRRLYKGRVVQVQLLEIVMDFHLAFSSSYSPAVDRVNVRFTYGRMAFRCMHEACVRAETTMGETMLLPTAQIKANVVARNAALRKRSKTAGVVSWANRSLNEEQRCAVRCIVEGTLTPLPYIIFGPPGTGAYRSVKTLLTSGCRC